MSARIMIVDDEQPIRDSLQGLFEDEGYFVDCAASGEEAVARFRKAPADCVVLDIWMPGIDGLETMVRLKQLAENVPIIIMSGHATIDTAVRATRQGAFDFVEKPLSSERLLIIIRNALEKRKLERENLDLKQNLAQQSRCDLIGESKVLKAVRQMVARAAATDAPVLILGEHGTGKSVVAHMIHQQSKRAKNAFVDVSMAGIPDSRMDYELFGFEKGAFPGALQAQHGRFEAAHGGSIFFDEVAELGLSEQAKILKIIQDRKVQRVGGVSPRPVDARLLAASSQNLEKAMFAGQVREDFYYKLNVVTIHLPPLRERAEDIPLLIKSLAEEQAQMLGGEPVSFGDDVITLMQGYSWNGNVRELRNYIERCHILRPGEHIEADGMLPFDLSGSAKSSREAPDFSNPFHSAKEAFEKSYLLHHLNKNSWNISHTAEDIGVERSQLHRKIKQYGLAAPKERKTG